MNSKLLLAFAAAGVLAAPAAGARDSAHTVCHRTGSGQGSNFFAGVIINVPKQAAEKHLVQHDDVLVGAAARGRFSNGGACLTDAAGNLYDRSGTLVQAVGGGDNGNGGGADGNGDGQGEPGGPG